MNLTDSQRNILRNALGLSQWTTVPTRNYIPGGIARYSPDDVTALIRAKYLTVRKIVGQTVTMHYEITDAGRDAVMQPKEEV